MIRLTTLLFAGVLAMASLPAKAFDMSALTAEERDAFRDEVRAYLLDNPEILMEAMEVLEQRQTVAQAAADAEVVEANAKALLEDDWSWVGGNPEGDITLVEFIDYRCSFCRRAHPEVEQLIAGDGNIRFIVKEFPILGEASLTSSRFAVAVLQTSGPEAYKKAHDALIGLRGEPTDARLRTLAEEIGADADAVMEAMGSEDVLDVIRRNRELGRSMGINGTPSFVLGGQLLRGYLPLANMQELVDIARGG